MIGLKRLVDFATQSEQVLISMYHFLNYSFDSDQSCIHRSIEDQVRETCADLVHDAVVVGFADKPVLVVEGLQTSLNDAAHRELAKQMVRRLAPFNKRLFLYEVSTSYGYTGVILPLSNTSSEDR